MNVGQEIFSQLKMSMNLVFCWGGSAFKVFDSETFSSTLGSHRGGLMFKVRGLKFNGHVVVVLNGKDLYNISIGHFRNNSFIVKEEIQDIYAEDFARVIDERIESCGRSWVEEQAS